MASRIFRPSPRDEVDEEFRFHVEMVIQDNLRKGSSRAAAENAALERFGDIEAVKAVCRASRRRRDEKMRLFTCLRCAVKGDVF